MEAISIIIGFLYFTLTTAAALWISSNMDKIREDCFGDSDLKKYLSMPE